MSLVSPSRAGCRHLGVELNPVRSGGRSTGTTLRRRVRRACLVAAGACVLLAVAVPSAPAQQDDGVPPPEVFRGAASALGASVQVDREALLPIPELFRFIALDGASTYESSTRQARASLLFPGNGLILGPSIACGTFGGQFPDFFKPILDTCLQYKYPLTVFADDFEPDGATSGSLALGAPTDPVSGNAVRAKAHAGEDASTTDAVMQDLRVLGVPGFGSVTPQIPGFDMDGSLLTVDSAVARTNQRIVDGGLAVDAESTMSGVRLIGGLIRIASLRSISHVTDDAAGHRTTVATLETTGVTVGGMPAQITDKGLVLGPSGTASPLDQARQSQINEVLRQLDVRVTSLGSHRSVDEGGAAVANVGGLLVEFARDVQGLPTVPGPVGELDPNGRYTGSIQLGATGVLGSAVNFGTEIVDEGGDLPSTGGETGFVDGGFDPGSGAFDAPTPVLGDTAAPVATPGASGPRTSERTQLARSLGGLFGDRIGLIYLSLMFAVLGCCVAPGLTVPARFPGRHS